MKMKHLLAICITGIFTFTACQEKTTVTPEDTNLETEESAPLAAVVPATASFNIEGMHCEVGCAKAIANKLGKLDGVTSAVVDFEKKTATINYDANMQTPEVFVQTVTNISEEYQISNLTNSTDQSSLFTGKDKEKKSKKKNKKEKEQTNTDTKSCSKDGDAKPGCCSKKGTM